MKWACLIVPLSIWLVICLLEFSSGCSDWNERLWGRPPLKRYQLIFPGYRAGVQACTWLNAPVEERR